MATHLDDLPKLKKLDSKKHLSVYLQNGLYANLKIMADEKGVALTTVIEQLLRRDVADIKAGKRKIFDE